MTTFANPPLAEVALGIQFEKIAEFKVTDYAEMWNLLGRAAFPNVENQPPLISIGTNVALGHTAFAIGVGPCDYILPRSWFVSKDGQLLFQLQADRFLFNWRKLDGGPETYLRFPALKKQFFEGFMKLVEFVKGSYGIELRALEAELTYVNFIPVDPKNIAEQSSRYLTSPSWQPALHKLLKNPVAMFSKDVFEGKRPDSKLEITCGSAQNAENGDLGIRIELVAKGPVDEIDAGEIDAWFEDHHNLIVDGFCDITTKEAHKEWGMKHAK